MENSDYLKKGKAVKKRRRLYLRLSFANCFKLPFISSALGPGIHLTIISGVGFTYRKTESPIPRVGFSVGVSPSGDSG